MQDTIRPANDIGALEDAWCRRVLYGVLSLGLGAPAAVTLERLAAADTRRALLDAAHALDRIVEAGGEHDQKPVLLADGAAALAQRLEHLGPEEVRRAHAELFGHVLRGRVCPYESEYGHDALFQQSHQLADVAGFYDAFGLATVDVERERPDHLSCELEFMEFLACKEATALQNRDASMFDATRAAARLFLAEHLRSFARAFAVSLMEQASGSYFGDMGRLLHDFMVLECTRYRLVPGPAVVPLRPSEEPDVPMQCGQACDVASCALEST